VSLIWRLRLFKVMFNIAMKAFIFAVLAGSASLSVAQAPASYPVKPISMIVPFPPGDVTDLAALELVKRLNDGAMLIIFS